MKCQNCQTPLIDWDQDRRNKQCPECDLFHNDEGNELGWLIAIKGRRGGLISRKMLAKAGVELKDSLEVATLIRMAAYIGMCHPEEVRALYEAEEKLAELDDAGS